MSCRVRELLPPSGRLCGAHVGDVVAAVATAWDTHPNRWLACAVLHTHIDLEYCMRLLRKHAGANSQRPGQATTRVFLPEAFEPDHIAALTRQVYAWRDEPHRALSSGRREPLQVGLLLLQVKELVLGLLVPPSFTCVSLHQWLTAGHLAETADLRASLTIRFLFYAKRLLDDYSVPYTPRWKQGSTQLFRLLSAIRHPQHVSFVPKLMARLASQLGPAVLVRLQQRISHEPQLDDLTYVFRLTFELGELSFEDVEAFCCEAKDALLHKRGTRARILRTAHMESFDLTNMPVDVCCGQRRSFVRLDMTPTAIIISVAGKAAAKATFEQHREKLHAARNMLHGL